MIRKLIPFVAALLIFTTGCTNSAKETENKEATQNDTLSAEVNSAELKKLNEMLKADPNNSHLYYKRGQVYLGFKDFAAAIEDANRALKIDSLKTDSFYILLTDASFTSGQTRLAKESLERCIK